MAGKGPFRVGTWTVCPGCGVRLASSDEPADSRWNASTECRKLYDELSLYTLSHGDPFFIHQVAVDAYTAQHVGAASKPIGVAFALIGLYLLLERGCTGRDVQRAHMRLARLTKTWPAFEPRQSSRGNLTVADVIQALSGDERDAMIRKWAGSVWSAWEREHGQVRALLDRLNAM